MAGPILIRRATSSDLPALGRLGALLMRTHYAFDRQRFLPPGDDPESGYAWFLETQLNEPQAVVFVAERDEDVVGYVYAGLEPLSWKELRGPAGFIHDIVVDESARSSGVARQLLSAARLLVARTRSTAGDALDRYEQCRRPSSFRDRRVSQNHGRDDAGAYRLEGLALPRRWATKLSVDTRPARQSGASLAPSYWDVLVKTRATVPTERSAKHWLSLDVHTLDLVNTLNQTVIIRMIQPNR